MNYKGWKLIITAINGEDIDISAKVDESTAGRIEDLIDELEEQERIDETFECESCSDRFPNVQKLVFQDEELCENCYDNARGEFYDE